MGTFGNSFKPTLEKLVRGTLYAFEAGNEKYNAPSNQFTLERGTQEKYEEGGRGGRPFGRPHARPGLVLSSLLPSFRPSVGRCDRRCGLYFLCAAILLPSLCIP